MVWFATFASLTGGSLVQPFLPLFINRDLGVSDPGTAAIWFGLATSGGGIAGGTTILNLPGAVPVPVWLHLSVGIAVVGSGPPLAALVGRTSLTLNLFPNTTAPWAIYLNGMSWAAP